MKPGLEDALATHGIPERINTDGGPPYSGHKFSQYCQMMGVEHHMTTPEDALANNFAEAPGDQVMVQQRKSTIKKPW